MEESTLGESLSNVNNVASVLVMWETKKGMKESKLGKRPNECKWCEKCFKEAGYLES